MQRHAVRTSRLLALAAVCLLAASPALAQSSGTLGFYFDTGYNQSDLSTVPVFMPFPAYLVASDIRGVDPEARLFGFETRVLVPAGFTVLGRTISTATALNVGTGSPDNFIVGMGQTIVPDVNGDVLLVTYQLGWFSQDPVPQNVRLDMIQSSPSSFDPPAPGWLEFEGQLYRFETIVPGRINPITCDLSDAVVDGTTIQGLDSGGGELFSVDTGKPVVDFLLSDLDGDGDPNLVAWTESDGATAGTLVNLNCQGTEVWSFTESGLACQPTDGLVDVSEVRVGEFDASNAGDEILVVSLHNAANDQPVVRVNLLDLDGARLGTAGESWVLGDNAVWEVDGDGLLVGVTNATSNAALVRLPIDNLRGAYPTQAGCLSGTEDAAVEWRYVVGQPPGSTLAFFQQESQITQMTVNGQLNVQMLSGQSYQLNASTLLPLPCDLVGLQFSPNGGAIDVQGINGGGGVEWTTPVLTTQLFLLELYDAANGPAVFGVADGEAFTLECHGKPAARWDAGSGVSVLSAQGAAAGTSAEGSYFILHNPGVGTRLSRVRPLADERFINTPAATDFAGTLIDFVQGNADGDGVDNVYVYGDGAGGAHVAAHNAADLSSLWSADFDGTGQYPLDLSGAITVSLGANVVTLTTANDTYDLDATTGDLLGGECTLDTVIQDGEILRGLDPDTNELFAYDPPGTLVDWRFLDDAAANKILIGLTGEDATGLATFFRVTCEGLTYATPLGRPNCFESTLGTETIDHFRRGGFTDPGADEWAVVIGRTVSVSQVVTANIGSGTVTSTYDFSGTVSELQFIGGTYVVSGRDDLRGAGVVFSLPPGVSGASGGCVSKEGENWVTGFDGGAPDRPQEEDIVSSADNGDGTLGVTADSGRTYTLDATDGSTQECGWESVLGANGVYTFLDAAGAELGQVDVGRTGGPGGSYPRDLGGSPENEVLVSASNLDETGWIFALTCQGQGQVWWDYDASDQPCFPVTSALALTFPFAAQATPAPADPVTVLGRGGDAYRVFNLSQGDLVGDYWHRGPLADSRAGNLLNDGRLLMLALGTNASTGGADLVLLDPDDLSGAAPTDPGTCDPGSQLWDLRWDGTDLPLETPDVLSLEGLDRVRVLMQSGTSYVVLLESGTVITSSLLTVSSAGPSRPGEEVTLEVSGAYLSGLAGIDGKVVYDPLALEVVEAKIGSLLLTAGGFSEAINVEDPGGIQFAFARATGLGSSEDGGEILRVTFRILEAAEVGETEVSLTGVNMFDEEGEPLAVETSPGFVEIDCDLYDVSGDDELHSNDAVLALRIDVELLDPTPTQFCAADIDGNGEVEAGDAVAILREIVGLPPLDTSAKDGVVVLQSRGPVSRTDRRVQIGLELTALDVAGLDLTLRSEGGTIVSLSDGAGARAVRHGSGTLDFASANAEPKLAADLDLQLVVDLTGALEDLRIFVERGAVFGRGGRAEVEAGEVTLDKERDPLGSLSATVLWQNRPNPFNPRTQIRFTLATPGEVRLSVYDPAGRRVRTLVARAMTVGDHEVIWDGMDEVGGPVASGVYLYRLTAPGVVQSRLMTLVR